jgi:catechol 2,3-dioxygenase-like lactoylglutathione lyase family enzyme
MTTLDQPVQTRRDTGRDILGVVVVALPVSNLVRSAAWYRDLLDLQYVREFGDQHDVSGCALADFASHYMIALRRRDATAERADLRGEHPIIVEAVDEAAANRIRTRAATRTRPQNDAVSDVRPENLLGLGGRGLFVGELANLDSPCSVNRPLHDRATGFNLQLLDPHMTPGAAAGERTRLQGTEQGLD